VSFWVLRRTVFIKVAFLYISFFFLYCHISIFINFQQAKERAVRAGDRLGERIGIKVLREDYLVEVLAVPISLRVEKGR
jgi:hypothetical protein